MWGGCTILVRMVVDWAGGRRAIGQSGSAPRFLTLPPLLPQPPTCSTTTSASSPKSSATVRGRRREGGEAENDTNTRRPLHPFFSLKALRPSSRPRASCTSTTAARSSLPSWRMLTWQTRAQKMWRPCTSPRTKNSSKPSTRSTTASPNSTRPRSRATWTAPVSRPGSAPSTPRGTRGGGRRRSTPGLRRRRRSRAKNSRPASAPSPAPGSPRAPWSWPRSTGRGRWTRVGRLWSSTPRARGRSTSSRSRANGPPPAPSSLCSTRTARRGGGACRRCRLGRCEGREGGGSRRAPARLSFANPNPDPRP